MVAVDPRPTLATTTEPTPWYRSPWSRAVGFVAAIVVLSVLQVYRQAGVRSWNTLWAEDGPTYLVQGNHLDALFRSYAGYLQLVPRVVGFGANLIPLAQVARYETAVSALVTSICAVAIYVLAEPLVPSRWLRGVLAVSTIAAPNVLFETLNTPTNLIWVLLFAGFWAVLVVPTTKPRAALACTLAFLGVVSSVLALLYLPLVGLLAWKRRTFRGRVVLLAYGVGVAIQGIAVLTAHTTESKHTTHAGDLLPIYGVRVLGGGVFGDSLSKTLWLDHGYVVGVVGAVVAVGVLGALAFRARGVHLCLGLICAAYSAGIFLFAVARRGSVGLELIAGRWNFNGSRFVALALWLLISALVLLASGARFSATAKRVVITALVVWFAVIAVTNYRAVNGRSAGPAWNAEVDVVTTWCRQHPRMATAIPITPPGWFTVLSCERVLR